MNLKTLTDDEFLNFVESHPIVTSDPVVNEMFRRLEELVDLMSKENDNVRDE
ncbi:hypothetical protein UFOVP820_25 [uncultured Caudovirales phage]|uniref:Uncharacterized protein n=1 Tax=uncultured Caudovirales phage TaxID=2100421 RepID=A0A6J5P7S6_9CAUD|nr:hypothetical protein UFOVP820_25 [uncultured Caudovirales phage]